MSAACSCSRHCRSRAEMRERHGTPDRFALSVMGAVPAWISVAEAERAIDLYREAYAKAPERNPNELPATIERKRGSTMKKKIIRDTSTEAGRKFWETTQRIAAQTKDWPDSRKAGINVSAVRSVSAAAMEHEWTDHRCVRCGVSRDYVDAAHGRPGWIEYYSADGWQKFYTEPPCTGYRKDTPLPATIELGGKHD